jgi:hypothetical protein
MTASTSSRFDYKKGERIRFISGKYDGSTGWLDTEKGTTAKMVNVIIAATGARRTEKESRVYKRSVQLVSDVRDAGTYEEAMLAQHRDINRLMEKLVSRMAECRVTARQSGREMTRILISKMEEAEIEQNALGHRATWRDVQFDQNNIVLDN